MKKKDKVKAAGESQEAKKGIFAVFKRDAKEHKALAAVYFVLRLIVIGIFVLGIIRGNYENSMTCILTLVLMLIPTFFERRLMIDVPNVLEVIILMFVFTANILGEIGAFYQKIPMLDTVLHTLNGFICAGVGFGLIDILNRSKRFKFDLSPMFVCLFSFCFSMTVGTVWEFFEFAMDFFFGKDMQKDTVISAINSVLLTGENTSEITRIGGIGQTIVNGNDLGINGYLDIGIIDTMKDLFVNFVGAVVFNVAGFFFLKYRGERAGFVANFIPSKIEKKAKKTSK